MECKGLSEVLLLPVAENCVEILHPFVGQETNLANEGSYAACRECAARKPQEDDLVPLFIVVTQEPVGLSHVLCKRESSCPINIVVPPGQASDQFS